MIPDIEDRLLAKIPEILASLLGIDHANTRARTNSPAGTAFVLAEADREFLVDFRSSTSGGAVTIASRRLREQVTDCSPDVVPLLAVPYMGDVGRRAWQETGYSWIDLSGNASIVAPGLKVMVEGRPNLYPTRGRPAN